MSNVIRVITDGVAKDFPTLEDAKKEFPKGKFIVVTDQSAQAQADIAAAAVREREWRDAELARTDTIVDASDYPNKKNMVAYRKELRDWPTTTNVPASPRPVLKKD